MPILIYSCEEVVRKRRFDYAILVTSSVALVMVKLICSMLEERCAVMKRVNYARMTKKSLFVCWCCPHWSIALAKKQVMCIPSGQSGCKGSKCKHGKMKSGDKNCTIYGRQLSGHRSTMTQAHCSFILQKCVVVNWCVLLPCVALRGLLKSTYSSWLGVALPGYQCSVHLCQNLFGVLDIDDCVSLYYTTHASCDIFKLVVNGLAKKRNGSAGLYRSTQRTSLSYAGDSGWNIPKFIEDRSYNHGQWMLCCWTQRYKEMIGSSAINWKLPHNN